MKRVVIVLLAVMLATSYWSPKVSAHVLKQDNGVSAVLHIDPDDNPVAGVKTLLDLDFSSTAGGFSLTDYQPVVTVMQNGKAISTAAIKPAYFGSGSEGVATVTFPSIGIYDVIVAGGNSSADTSRFSLDYTERVATGKNVVASNGLSLEIGAVSLTSLIILAVIAQDHIHRGQRYAVKSNREK